MEEIVRRRTWMRDAFLRTLYEQVQGLTSRSVLPDGLADAMGLSDEDLQDVLEFLANEGLIDGTVGLRRVSLTHEGKKVVEDATNPRNLADTLVVAGILIAGSQSTDPTDRPLDHCETSNILELLKETLGRGPGCGSPCCPHATGKTRLLPGLPPRLLLRQGSLDTSSHEGLKRAVEDDLIPSPG